MELSSQQNRREHSLTHSRHYPRLSHYLHSFTLTDLQQKRRLSPLTVFASLSTPPSSMTPPSRASPPATPTKSSSTSPSFTIFLLAASSAFSPPAPSLSPRRTPPSSSAQSPSTPTVSTPKSTVPRPSPSAPPSTRSALRCRVTALVASSRSPRLLCRTVLDRLLLLRRLHLTVLLRRWRSTLRTLTLRLARLSLMSLPRLRLSVDRLTLGILDTTVPMFTARARMVFLRIPFLEETTWPTAICTLSVFLPPLQPAMLRTRATPTCTR